MRNYVKTLAYMFVAVHVVYRICTHGYAQTTYKGLFVQQIRQSPQATALSDFTVPWRRNAFIYIYIYNDNHIYIYIYVSGDREGFHQSYKLHWKHIVSPHPPPHPIHLHWINKYISDDLHLFSNLHGRHWA